MKSLNIREMHKEIMRNIFAAVLFFITLTSSSFAYEVNKIQKINNINSYQPVQFTNVKYKKTKKAEPEALTPLQKLENFHIDSHSADIVEEAPTLIEEEPLLKKSGVEKNTIKSTRWSRFMTWAKGVPADDGLLLTMNSYHTSGKRDQYNESHDLIGMQYKGYTFGYFENSHHRTSLFLCWAREVWSSPEWKGFSVNLQHKTGLLSGYRHHAPNLFNVSPIILPIIGLNYKKISADIWVTPNVAKPIFSISTRIGFPEFKKRHKINTMPKQNDSNSLREDVVL